MSDRKRKKRRQKKARIRAKRPPMKNPNATPALNQAAKEATPTAREDTPTQPGIKDSNAASLPNQALKDATPTTGQEISKAGWKKLREWLWGTSQEYAGGLAAVATVAIISTLFFVYGSRILDRLPAWLSRAFSVAPARVESMLYGDVPRADPKRFAVAVAHLDRDERGEWENLILRNLETLKTVQVLSFDRTIKIAGADVHEASNTARQRARDYLSESGAHVLIWGTVVRRDGKSAPQLWLTRSAESVVDEESKPYDPGERFHLPEIFWSDLSQVLILVIAAQHNEFAMRAQRSSERPRLDDFIEKVRRVVDNSYAQPGWNEHARNYVRLIIGNTFLMVGEGSADRVAMREADGVFRKGLDELDPLKEPELWAGTQNNIGLISMEEGKRDANPERLAEAVEAFRKAAKVFTLKQTPLDYAATQTNLGAALGELGVLTADAAHLQDALSTIRAALTVKEITLENAPMEWARAHSNLGAVLATLAEREVGTAKLHEAATSYRKGLDALSQPSAPLLWARVRNNLGRAIFQIGLRENDTGVLEEAVTIHSQTVQSLKPERAPVLWASLGNSLGMALLAIGQHDADMVHTKLGVDALRDASSVSGLTSENAPVVWAQIQNNLGLGLAQLGVLEGKIELLQEGLDVLHAALDVQRKRRIGLDWARTLANVGTAQRLIGVQRRVLSQVCAALESHLESWDVLSSSDRPAGSTSAQAIDEDLSALKDHFGPQAVQPCLTRNGKLLRRFHGAVRS